jgi:DNA polymerase I
MPQRLFLIDGYSNIFRAFYAIRGLSNSKGEPTNAVYGFVQMLRKLLRDEAPELVGVALDVSRKTVRTEKFADYKANRAPMPEDLRPQIPYIRQALEAFRIPVLELENYEADDVLGTLAKKGAAAGYEVVLVSADKDLMQLVGPGVSLYHTGRDKLYDAAAVEEDFGVPPERVADVLALMGDAVDNVPGVPGIGEKGAPALIAKYGTLENLLDHASEVSPKRYREGLEQHRAQAELSKELATIHTDLPLELDPGALHHDPPDPEGLRRLYTELEFRTLLEELGASSAPGEAVPPAEEVASAAEWAERAAAPGEEVHLAVVGEREVLGLALAAGDAAPALADFRRPGLRQAALATVAELAAGSGGRRLVGHDLKEVLRLVAGGPECGAELVDLMLISYLLRPAQGHALEDLARERLGVQPVSAKEAGWGKGQEPPPGSEGLLAYAGERVGLARRMAAAMVEELGDGPLGRIYRDVEAPLVPVLLGMEEAGVLLDVAYLREMSKELGEEVRRLETEVYDLAGEAFNINSPQQLGVILFEKLGYPVLKKTRKTKSYATGAEVLEQLAAQGYALPERLLRYRELSKLKSTYVDALPALVAADGRLHTRFNQAVAATGRLSSANPNLQNIPVRTEQGQRIRRAFVAPPGRLLLVADYSQIELRVLAHIAGEEALVEAFRAGEDVHRATAASVFGIAAGLVSPDQRRAAKTINFGIIYGISGFGLAQQLGGGVSPKEADRFIKSYLDRYPGVSRYVEETLKSAQKEGKVETLYGRARWLPDVNSKNWNLRENARRMAINARIQGTAADLMKIAMIRVDRRLRADHADSQLLLTVHDELVLEVPEGAAAAVGEMVKREMEGVADLAVPLVVDVASGQSWYEAKG